MIVSKGANIILEHPAASALAIEFLTPLTHAASDLALIDESFVVDSGTYRLRGKNDGLLALLPGKAKQVKQKTTNAILKREHHGCLVVRFLLMIGVVDFPLP